MAKLAQIESYITYQKSTDKSPATLASYRSDLMQFARWFESVNTVEMRLTNITPTDARQYKQHLIDTGLRPQTINRRLLSLKYFLNWGWDTKKIKHRFPLPQAVKQSQPIPKWLNRLQQNQLLRHVERYGSVRDTAIIKVLMNSGLRVSELCSIKWLHISISDRKGRLLVNAGMCKMILQNIIILWNYIELTKIIMRSDKETREALLENIMSASIMTWQHVNLHGTYDFSNLFAANDNFYSFDEVVNFKAA